MPRREPGLLIEDMLTAIRKIERYTAGMDQDLFRQDDRTARAQSRVGRADLRDPRVMRSHRRHSAQRLTLPIFEMLTS